MSFRITVQKVLKGVMENIVSLQIVRATEY